MKKLLAVTALFLAFGFNSTDAIAKEKQDDCYIFATQAANSEWGSTVHTNAEYYEAWNFWYQSCNG